VDNSYNLAVLSVEALASSSEPAKASTLLIDWNSAILLKPYLIHNMRCAVALSSAILSAAAWYFRASMFCFSAPSAEKPNTNKKYRSAEGEK
jgi:hypothetical protein